MSGTLLLVEDNQDDEALMLRALWKHDVAHDIVVARDLKQATDYLFSRGTWEHRNPRDTPKLMLLDLKLNADDGLDILREVRENETTQGIPVVVLTSSDEPDDVERSYDAGASSYVRKPINYEEFTATILRIGKYWMGLNETLPT